MPVRATLRLQGYRLPFKYRVICALVNLAFWIGIRVRIRTEGNSSLIQAVIHESQLERAAKYFNRILDDMIAKRKEGSS